MSSMQPTNHPLMDLLLEELQRRNIDMDDAARAAIEEEFSDRLKKSVDKKATLDEWNRNLKRYANILSAIAKSHRRLYGIANVGPVMLNEQDVRASFNPCPGPT